MPYFTKKGIGKEKGKTCVYKKEDKTKVGCTDGSVKKYLAALYVNESQEDDLEWIRDIEADLVPGEIYDIKSGNGYYWVPEKFIGKSNDDGHDIYLFKDLKNSGSGMKSASYVRSLIEKGNIREYDPNWSIKDEITFSDNIEDALKGNFVIYFKDGVELDQTLAIQDKLFEMGFSFYTKAPNQYITNKDTPKKIQFFESFNWDTSNPRYANMPSNQRDQKKILITQVKSDDDIRWRFEPNPRLDDQELFLTIKDHDAVVINGDKYITNNINESDDFDWIRDIEPPVEHKLSDISVGDKFDAFRDIITITSLEKKNKVMYDGGEVITEPYYRIEFRYRDGELDATNSDIFLDLWNRNQIIKIITESVDDDFDWIRKEEPEKTLKKSKSYVIDVRHLRGQPPSSPTSTDYTDLTRLDILSKLNELGYDISNIDVDSATYFFIEPNDHPGWEYDDEGNLIEYDYWVDYMTTKIDDPTMNGKYQMIDVKQLEFLLDNNLISENGGGDFGWLENMSEPMSVCEATLKLNVGDTIIIDQLLYWEDSPEDEKYSVKNATATVLAVDACDKIHPINTSKADTILVHINDEYTGFDEYWVSEFKPEYVKPCMDGRCMFLICGDDDQKITKLDSKLFSENKKPINESAGISFEVRKWSKIIYDEIISNPEEKTRLIIDGYNHPEAFDGFPIDYIVIDFYDRLTGYGQEHSGYDKDGNYIVHLYIQPQLIGGRGGYSLQSALNHELKHAWEDYNRLSKGLPSIEQTKESQELYNRDYILMLSDQNVRGPIKEILKYYYYLSKLETSAYLENVYDQNPAYERMVREIVSKDFESFKDRFDLEVNWHLMNTAYDIPFLKKFKSAVDFIDYSAKELRSRALKMIKKINKMKYVHQK